MKILVTGGAGFIGSNVVDAYVAAGHEVIVVDNLSSGKLSNINPKTRFYLLDIRSNELKKVFEFEKPDIVNYHAAQISVTASVKDPLFDADVNIKGFLNLLESARLNKTKKLILISSGGAIYGEAEEYPTTEACRPKPLSPYAISKLVTEQYLSFYNHCYGLDYTVLRYSNVFGPRQIPNGEAGVVAIFMERLLNNNPCTLYHFNDETRGMVRDYCFVGDVVRANLLALDKGSMEAFNIGTGVETFTEDLFAIVYESAKKNMPGISYALERKAAKMGELKRSCLNIEKAKSGLGWQPQICLSEGIEITMKWWSSEMNRLGIKGYDAA
ncbi:MAG: NAD-dependent epimerase/dehydratase family protein [Deltaproteobacteria bacterium]|nr:NAD-dependent epimerase/dehydratase family protein [Deltaproteobacteria bacterium]